MIYAVSLLRLESKADNWNNIDRIRDRNAIRTIKARFFEMIYAVSLLRLESKP